MNTNKNIKIYKYTYNFRNMQRNTEMKYSNMNKKISYSLNEKKDTKIQITMFYIKQLNFSPTIKQSM